MKYRGFESTSVVSFADSLMKVDFPTAYLPTHVFVMRILITEWVAYHMYSFWE